MFSIPDGSVPTDLQAQPDSVDFQILERGLRGDGVITVTDLVVSQHTSPNMSVDYTAGMAQVAHLTSPVIVAGTATITASDPSNPRFDLICATTSGTVTVTAGTVSATPVFPDIPANSCVLAAVLVPAGITSITNARIVDKRTLAAYDPGSLLFLRANY